MDPEYDYVVVGSGPGGGPVAARLAIAGYRVLLIDAGDDQGNSIIQQVPALQTQSTQDPAQRWDFFVHHYADDTRKKRTPSLSGGRRMVGHFSIHRDRLQLRRLVLLR